MDIDVQAENYRKIAEDYNRGTGLTENRLTLRQFGLGLINRLVDEGYRVIVKAKIPLGYINDTYRDGKSEVLEGACSYVVLPNRRGEITYIEIPESGDKYSPHIEQMTWFESDSDDYGGHNPSHGECLQRDLDLLDNILVEEIVHPI